MSGANPYIPLRAREITAAIRSSGQLHKRGLCRALNCEYQAIDATVSEMVRRGELEILGTAEEAGYTDIRRDAPVYGLPGMTLTKIDHAGPVPRVGSGQVAPSREPWPFRPLMRNLLADHMRLALLIRR